MSAKDNIYGSPGSNGEYSSGGVHEVKKPPAGKGFKGMRFAVALAVLLAAAAIAASGSFVVTKPNEYKVIQQFGRIVNITYQPGLSFKLPFVQTVRSIPKDILLYDLPISDVITMDKKNMVTDSFVLWRVTDPQMFIQAVEGSVTSARRRGLAQRYITQ